MGENVRGFRFCFFAQAVLKKDYVLHKECMFDLVLWSAGPGIMRLIFGVFALLGVAHVQQVGIVGAFAVQLLVKYKVTKATRRLHVFRNRVQLGIMGAFVFLLLLATFELVVGSGRYKNCDYGGGKFLDAAAAADEDPLAEDPLGRRL